MIPKCPICGWIGYTSLTRFQCAGPTCQNHSQEMIVETLVELTTALVNPTIQEWDATHTYKVREYPPYKLGLNRNIYYDALRYEIEIFSPGFCEPTQVLQYTPATLYITPENYDQRGQLKDVLPRWRMLHGTLPTYLRGKGLTNVDFLCQSAPKPT